MFLLRIKKINKININFLQKQWKIVFSIFFVSCFFVFNFNLAKASSFKLNIQDTNWEINNQGIYKNNDKINCSDINIADIDSVDLKSENVFLIQDSGTDRLLLISSDVIYVSSKNSFNSIKYSNSFQNSFILKDAEDNILLYVDKNGLHYREGMCVEDVECQIDNDCDAEYLGCYTEGTYKTKVRVGDSYGVCNDGVCDYSNTSFLLGCVENQCGATCNSSSDCGSNSYCSWLEDPACHCHASSGGGGGGGCFQRGTKILTPQGEINIEDIKIGDIVLSFNEKTNEFVENRVKELLIHKDYKDPAVSLILENGQQLFVTKNHPFPNIDVILNNDNYKNTFYDYLRLEFFKPGDRVVYLDKKTKNIELVKIKEMIPIDYFDVEYNLRLDYPNNFFANGLLVHNTDCVGACTENGHIDWGCYYNCIANDNPSWKGDMQR